MKHTYTNEEYNNWYEYIAIVMKWRKNKVLYHGFYWEYYLS